MSGDPASPGDNPYASPTAGGPAPAGGSAVITQDEKLWAMLAHLAGLLGYAVALGQYVGPLIIYLIYKDKSRFVAFHALQSLLFQLALLVASGLVVIVAIFTCGIGVVLAPVVLVLGLVYVIVAAMKANQGEWFEYWLVGEWARKM